MGGSFFAIEFRTPSFFLNVLLAQIVLIWASILDKKPTNIVGDIQ